MTRMHAVIFLFISCCAGLFSGAAHADEHANSTNVIRLSEPVMSDATSETFGAPFNDKLPVHSLTQLLNNPSQYLNSPFSVETNVAKVCQKKGCFFIAQESGQTIRVAFKDYGFFIPTDSGAKQVKLNGMLVKKVLSEGQAQHFSSDINDEMTLQPGETFEILASSVVVPRF